MWVQLLSPPTAGLFRGSLEGRRYLKPGRISSRYKWPQPHAEFHVQSAFLAKPEAKNGNMWGKVNAIRGAAEVYHPASQDARIQLEFWPRHIIEIRSRIQG